MDTLVRPHGSRARYVREECRCAPCTAANTEYQRSWTRNAARPDGLGALTVDAGMVRAHLAELVEAGLGLRTIAIRANVARSTLQAIIARKRSRIRLETASAILSVSDHTTARHACVDAEPARQVLEVLERSGWPRPHIARSTGLGGYHGSLRLRCTRVRVDTISKLTAFARHVGVEFDDNGLPISNALPPAAFASLQASGFAPHLAIAAV